MTTVVIQPAEEVWQKVTKEPMKDEDRTKQDLTVIKEWLRKQPHLPDEWDDECLMSFLRGCDFSLEKCKRKLDMYFTMRNACPEFFTNRDITRPELTDVMLKGQCTAMPGLTPEGRKICIGRALSKTLDLEHLLDIFKVTLMLGDLKLKEEQNDHTGDVYIIDGGIVDTRHIAKLSPYISMIKKYIIISQEAYPVKLKEVHIINTSPLIDFIYNIVKPFLKDKLRKRILFHKDHTGLHKHIPIEMLPLEWGGTGQSLVETHDEWFKKLKQYGDWFKKQESIKANEALRPGKPTNYDELFGIDGSFRQLAID